MAGRDAGAPLLELDGVAVHLGARSTVRAVDGVDLRVDPGEVVALVGESGCGKTTLIRSVVGLTRPTAGVVRFEGDPVPERGTALRRWRRGVQMVFQDPTGALDPRCTVGAAVAEGLRVHRVAGDHDALVLDALARAGLRPPERFVDRFPHEISGGQRQRVLIAGAMVLAPRLVLADEPVASLDASVRGEILGLMRSLVDDTGVAIVVVTHDLGVAWNIADRIAVMYLGRIVEEGPTEEVLARPTHPYTRALLSVVPETAHVEPVVLGGEPPDPANVPAGCRFHPRCPLVASGEAALLGIEARCRTEDVALTPVRTDGAPHLAACHAVSVAATPAPATTSTPD